MWRRDSAISLNQCSILGRGNCDWNADFRLLSYDSGWITGRLREMFGSPHLLKELCISRLLTHAFVPRWKPLPIIVTIRHSGEIECVCSSSLEKSWMIGDLKAKQLFFCKLIFRHHS